MCSLCPSDILKFNFCPDTSNNQYDNNENDAHHIGGTDAGTLFGMGLEAAIQNEMAAKDAYDPNA